MRDDTRQAGISAVTMALLLSARLLMPVHQVLGLYRAALRAAVRHPDPGTRASVAAYARHELDARRLLGLRDVQLIEHLIRKGRRQLAQMQVRAGRWGAGRPAGGCALQAPCAPPAPVGLPSRGVCTDCRPPQALATNARLPGCLNGCRTQPFEGSGGSRQQSAHDLAGDF